MSKTSKTRLAHHAPGGTARVLPLLFLPCALVYHEWLLQIFDKENPFFSPSLLPITAFALATGLVLALGLNLIRQQKVKTVIAAVLTFAWTVFECIEYCCKSYFKSYFGFGYMEAMTGHVLGSFFGTMIEVILERIPFILLSLVPFAALLIWRRVLLAPIPYPSAVKWAALGAALVLQVCGMVMGHFGPYRNVYTYDFTANSTIPRFGLVTQLRLEALYAVTGVPEQPAVDITRIVDEGPSLPPPEEYGENALDIDFAALAEGESNETLAAMHRYFAAKPATYQNEYTGLFAGKNLILITAEAFSPYVISPDLTPMLYKMTHEGFVFTDYYQPAWGQSTTGGEYASMTGLIPTWVNGNVSFYASARDYMPLALGNQLGALGYDCRAWHNNEYTYYERNKTHPNLGYLYVGCGNGLKLKTNGDGSWPYSDLEMMEATVDEYLTNYTDHGTPFHAYYMTVSGHANWGWTQAMSARHKAEAQAAYPNASTTVQAFIAANLEVELSLQYLYDRLSEAGALEDTVICMTADHYPYAMVGEGFDYYPELSGIDDTEKDISRYKSTWLLWSGSMDAPITVDTPCTAVDILPTLSNLFGLSYDSRLLSGRDVLDGHVSPTAISASMPIAIIPTSAGVSWRTLAGTYDCHYNTFTPRPGVTVPENYCDNVIALVDAKYSYAKLVIAYDYYNAVYPGGTGNAAAYVPYNPPVRQPVSSAPVEPMEDWPTYTPGPEPTPVPETPTPESPTPENPTPETPTPETPTPETPTPETPTPETPTTQNPTPETPPPETPSEPPSENTDPSQESAGAPQGE